MVGSGSPHCVGGREARRPAPPQQKLLGRSLQEAEMAHRRVSTVIDDMIQQRLLSCSKDDEGELKEIDRRTDELKIELELSLGALVAASVQELKEAGLL